MDEETEIGQGPQATEPQANYEWKYKLTLIPISFQLQ
jgi:hypothetical protein